MGPSKCEKNKRHLSLQWWDTFPLAAPACFLTVWRAGVPQILFSSLWHVTLEQCVYFAHSSSPLRSEISCMPCWAVRRYLGKTNKCYLQGFFKSSPALFCGSLGYFIFVPWNCFYRNGVTGPSCWWIYVSESVQGFVYGRKYKMENLNCPTLVALKNCHKWHLFLLEHFSFS